MPTAAIHVTAEQSITTHPYRSAYSPTASAKPATFVASILDGGAEHRNDHVAYPVPGKRRGERSAVRVAPTRSWRRSWRPQQYARQQTSQLSRQGWRRP